MMDQNVLSTKNQKVYKRTEWGRRKIDSADHLP